MPVVHCKKEKYDIYIGRPSEWGNPYSHRASRVVKKNCETREQAIEYYKRYLWEEIKKGKISLESLAELDGKTLGCWCSPKACHGDILLQAAAWAKKELISSSQISD